MGVLQGLGAEPTPAPAPIKLKPPTPKAHAAQGMPSLIAPTAAPAQAVAPATPQQQPVIAKPAPVIRKSEPEPVKEAVSKAPVVPAEKPSAPKVVKAPIVSKAPEMPPDNLPLKSAPPHPTPPPPVAAQQPAAVLEPVKPIAVTDPVPVLPDVVEEIKPIVAEKSAEPEEEALKVTNFPLEQKIRKETTDPASINTSRPVPVRTGIAGNLKDVVPSRPAPDLDPAAVAEEESVPVRDLTEEPEVTEKAAAEPESKATSADIKKADAPKAPVIPGRKPANPNVETKVAETSQPTPEPVVEKAPEAKPVEAVAETKPEAPVIPPRRPDNVQKAPPELVAELRAREAAKELEASEPAKPKTAIDLSNPPPPPGPRGKKNMPAVAKAPVESEQLTEQTIKLAAESDPLLDRLVEKDKASLVATIESMVAEREDGKPLPGTPKREKREQGTSIVKAEPMQRPYNVYRPKKDNEAPAETTAPAAEEVKTAELTDAAAPTITPRPPEPRSQDEEAYVSVPFSQGLTEIDTKITNEIETRLLPVLNDNPGWKLQIQAFASPVKDGASSARKASLARAMSVRTYLLGKGIEANRMDIRALGAESDRDPMDRVDMIVFDPGKRG